MCTCICVPIKKLLQSVGEGHENLNHKHDKNRKYRQFLQCRMAQNKKRLKLKIT